MLFTLRNRNVDYDSDNTNFSECVKFLGVYLDTSYCLLMQKNCFENISVKKPGEKLIPKTLLTAYFGLIHSYIAYAILAWGHASRSSTVLAAQRKAVRIVANLSYRDDCKQAFIKFKILTLPCLYIFQCLLYIKSNIQHYTRHNQIHKYPTRNKEKVNPNFHRLSRSRYGPSYYGIKFYNTLPQSVTHLSYEYFKHSIKTLL
ncbi:hypothetical protein NQ318_007525, partial [Aromia moschata]